MSAIVTSTRRWVLNYYITRRRQEAVNFEDKTSWRQDAVEKASTQRREPLGPRLIVGSQTSWREDAGLRNMSQRGWAPRPPVEQPRRT